MSSKTVQNLIDASYKKNKGAAKIAIDNGYYFDNKLSNREAKVFVNKVNNTPTVVYTGSRKYSDILTDGALAIGLLSSTKRLDRSKNLMNEVKDKYKGKHISTYGHSLGGSLAQSVGGDKIVTVNRGVGLFGVGHKKNQNQFVIRTSTDPVSLLSRLQVNKKKIVIPHTTYLNPLRAHSYLDVGKLNTSF